MKPAVALALVLAAAGGAGAQAPVAVPDARAQAQARVQQRIMDVLRQRVGLSEDQLRRLAPISRSYTGRRQDLFRQERTIRQALRRELGAEAPDQSTVAAHIDALLSLQRRRLDLAAEEQRELAEFMTPVQRARYLALQEHLRRRAEEFRRSRPPR
jgi:hypothetical protein